MNLGATVAFALATGPASVRDRTMAAVYAAGARWLRVDTPDTSEFDPLVQSALAHGLKVDLLVQDWRIPDTPAAMRALATTLARHYAPEGVHTYEILNETAFYLSAATYTSLLKAAYVQLHAIDPAANVVSAGLAEAGGASEPYNYLADMYAAGAGGYMDSVGVHPYSFPNTPNTSDPQYNPWQYMPMGGWSASQCAGIGPSKCLRSIMVANGDGNKKMWLTEFGVPVGTAGGVRAFSLQQQATSITEAFAAANLVDYSGPLFVYEWQDDPQGDFGLVDAANNPRPALQAFTDAVSQPSPPPSNGPIGAYYLSLGGPGSYLGTPVGSESGVAGGLEQPYQNGYIFWAASTGAHVVHGAILSRYLAFGGPSGILGFPTSDETGTPDGVARYNTFAGSGGSSLYWTPQSGAFETQGAIYAKWAAMGGEAGLLGYPVTDESNTADGIGRYNHFSNDASIFWTPTTAAWSVHGSIRAAWASMGWERGPLGYPISDEYAVNGGRRSDFQRGSITWNANTGAIGVGP